MQGKNVTTGFKFELLLDMWLRFLAFSCAVE
jgi:hypothetical protein